MSASWRGIKNRGNKYGAKKVTTPEGMKFDSKREYARWLDLKLMERACAISDLKRQQPYDINVNGQKICRYIADFTYIDDDDRFIVEDSKGFRTPEYRLKAKLMLAVHNIKIRET